MTSLHALDPVRFRSFFCSHRFHVLVKKNSIFSSLAQYMDAFAGGGGAAVSVSAAPAAGAGAAAPAAAPAVEEKKVRIYVFLVLTNRCQI